MSIFCFGLTHRTAPVDVRESFAISVSALPEAYVQRYFAPGDTNVFTGPVWSSGVFIAVLSAEKAADMLDRVLRRPEHRALEFRRYERHLGRVMNLYLNLVNSWYTQEFAEVFQSARVSAAHLRGEFFTRRQRETLARSPLAHVGFQFARVSAETLRHHRASDESPAE